jgi:hypothetical protein
MSCIVKALLPTPPAVIKWNQINTNSNTNSNTYSYNIYDIINTADNDQLIFGHNVSIAFNHSFKSSTIISIIIMSNSQSILIMININNNKYK